MDLEIAFRKAQKVETEFRNSKKPHSSICMSDVLVNELLSLQKALNAIKEAKILGMPVLRNRLPKAIKLVDDAKNFLLDLCDKVGQVETMHSHRCKYSC